jgi:hypothetical protein
MMVRTHGETLMTIAIIGNYTYSRRVGRVEAGLADP